MPTIRVALVAVALAGPLAGSATATSSPAPTSGALPEARPLSATGDRRDGDKGDRPLFVPTDLIVEQALATGVERNLPVVLLIAQEGEEASEKFAQIFMSSPDLARRSAEYLALVGNDGVHERKEFEVGQDATGAPIKKKLCEKFRTETCKTHQANVDRAWLAYSENGELRLPCALVVDPRGEVYRRLYSGHPIAPESILSAVEKWHAENGPALSVDELARVRAALDRARTGTTAERWERVWMAAREVLEITPVALYADPARAHEGAAVAGLRAQHALVIELAQTDPVAAYDRLSERRETWRETPLEEDVRKALRALERGKDSKDLIRAHKRELEAGGLLEEARELFRNGETRDAEKKIRVLLNKFADTRAGVQAAKDYPGLVP